MKKKFSFKLKTLSNIFSKNGRIENDSVSSKKKKDLETSHSTFLPFLLESEMAPPINSHTYK